MFKKVFCLAFCFVVSSAIQVKSEVVAPAIQYLRSDYPAAFLTNLDYTAKIQEHAKYRLKCSSSITGVAIGDKENVRVIPRTEEDEEEMLLWEQAGPNDVTIKTRKETYTYIQIFKEEGSPIAAFLHINRKNEVPNVVQIGDCTLVERND